MSAHPEFLRNLELGDVLKALLAPFVIPGATGGKIKVASGVLSEDKDLGDWEVIIKRTREGADLKKDD